MTDFLNELQDDIQEENFFNLWRHYGQYLLLLMVTILGVTGGYLWWQYHREQTLASQSLQYDKAVALIQEKKFDAALSLLEALEKTHDGYKLLAQLQKSSLKMQQALTLEEGKKAEALHAAFAPFLGKGTLLPPLRNLATIELGYALLAAGAKDFMVSQAIEAYIAPQNPWKGVALELSLLQAFQNNTQEKFKEKLVRNLYNKDVPPRIQARIALEAIGMGLSLQDNSTP